MKIEELVDKILNFGEVSHDFKFRPYQRKKSGQIIRATILHEPGTYTTLWTRKSGKSEMLKITMLSLMSLLPGLAHTHLVRDFPRLRLFKDGLHIAFAGPKLDTARIPFVRLRRQARQKSFIKHLSSLNVYVHASNSNQIELSNGSIATAFSGSETASNEGPGAEILLIDEASMITPFSMYKILRPMIAHVSGLISLTGTPSRRKCPFLADINYNKRKFPDLHQEIPYQGVIPYSTDYAQFIDGEIDRLPGGEDNPFFRMNYLLEWLIAEGHFVDPEIFVKLNVAQRGPSGGKLVAGIDWGKVESSTAITILEGKNGDAAVIDLLEIKGSWDKQFDYLVPFLKNYPLRKIFSESTGMGDPLTERLTKELGKSKVEGKYMTAPYKDQIFTKLQTEITATSPRFSYFEDDTKESKNFIRQFLDAEQEIHGNLLAVHKPEEEGSADDFLISTALAMDALQSTPSGGIEYKSTGKKRGVLSALENF